MTASFHHSLWAVHIADDFLSTQSILIGFGLMALLIGMAVLVDRVRAKWTGQELREEEIAYIAVLTSAFFVASLIHIRVGPTTVHLLLNCLLGVVLRWRAALAIPVGLLLQAALFGHGGFSALGVNSCVIVLPALMAWLVFAGLSRAKWLQSIWFRRGLVFSAGVFLILSLIFSVSLIVRNWSLPESGIDTAWAIRISFHPAVLGASFAFGVILAWLEPRLEHKPEFPLGFFVGILTVLATLGLNSLALLYGGSEDWRLVAMLNFTAHLPVAVIEGIVLGFVVSFLAQVRPEMLGLPRLGTARSKVKLASPSRNGQSRSAAEDKENSRLVTDIQATGNTSFKDTSH